MGEVVATALCRRAPEAWRPDRARRLQRSFCIVTRAHDHDTKCMNFTKNIGMLLLAIYLIVVGLIGIFGISLGGIAILMPILALAAGIFILIGR